MSSLTRTGRSSTLPPFPPMGDLSKLPPELRLMIWGHLFPRSHPGNLEGSNSISIISCNRYIYQEVSHYLYGDHQASLEILLTPSFCNSVCLTTIATSATLKRQQIGVSFAYVARLLRGFPFYRGREGGPRFLISPPDPGDPGQMVKLWDMVLKLVDVLGNIPNISTHVELINSKMGALYPQKLGETDFYFKKRSETLSWGLWDDGGIANDPHYEEHLTWMKFLPQRSIRFSNRFDHEYVLTPFMRLPFCYYYLPPPLVAYMSRKPRPPKGRGIHNRMQPDWCLWGKSFAPVTAKEYHSWMKWNQMVIDKALWGDETEVPPTILQGKTAIWIRCQHGKAGERAWGLRETAKWGIPM